MVVGPGYVLIYVGASLRGHPESRAEKGRPRRDALQFSQASGSFPRLNTHASLLSRS